jgi:hypothetical protein
MTMKRSIFFLLLALLALPAVVTYAEPDAPFTLTWDAVASGGGASTGGAYALNDTVGLPLAGASTGGSFILVDGFGAADGGGGVILPAVSKTYLPLLLRSQ